MAATSAPVSGRCSLTASSGIELMLPLTPLPRSGVARLAALMLGSEFFRKALLLSLTSLPIDGSAALVTTATASQNTTTPSGSARRSAPSAS